MPCHSVRKDAWVPAAVDHGADWQGPPLEAEALQPLAGGLGARGGSTSCRKPAGSLSTKAAYRSHIRESPGGQRGDMGLKDARGPPEEASATPAHPAGTHSHTCPGAQPGPSQELPQCPCPSSLSPQTRAPRGPASVPPNLVSSMGTLGTHHRVCEK